MCTALDNCLGHCTSDQCSTWTNTYRQANVDQATQLLIGSAVQLGAKMGGEHDRFSDKSRLLEPEPTLPY